MLPRWRRGAGGRGAGARRLDRRVQAAAKQALVPSLHPRPYRPQATGVQDGHGLAAAASGAPAAEVDLTEELQLMRVGCCAVPCRAVLWGQAQAVRRRRRLC